LPGVAPVSEPARIRARGVARAVGAVARCAMAPDPEDRYPSAAAMADDLRRAAAGLPTQAAPAGPLAHLRGLWRQRPGLCAAGAAAIICLGAGAAVASAAYVRASRAEQALRESNESLRSVVAALAGG